MKTFKFEVTVTETYTKQFDITADNEEEARESLKNELDACPLDTQSGTFQSSETNVENID